jgi:DNA phosphorothioation-associated DGQHR protein 1
VTLHTDTVEFPLTVPAIEVEQPIGTFYVAVLPANLLLEVAYTDRVRARKQQNGTGYQLEGSQRNLAPERLGQIAAYIGRADSSFPNSVILAANFREADGTIEERDEKRWRIGGWESRPKRLTLTIPTNEKLAAVIDGQHRLFAFGLDSIPHSRLATPLICSIFLDLPRPFQAQLFATINSTQRPVDKSLTFELFGYNIDEETSNYWSPDKLSVFLARKLNTETKSPFENRIRIAPEADFITTASLSEDQQWTVSMATVVDGIMRLISNNPKADSAALLTPNRKPRSSINTSSRKDPSPLREEYISGNDQLVYLLVKNYFLAVEKLLWTNTNEGSFITKTVGVQALFDILRKICRRAIDQTDVSEQFFVKQLSKLSVADFSHVLFRNASGSGRVRIRRYIEVLLGLIEPEEVGRIDPELYAKVRAELQLK